MACMIPSPQSSGSCGVRTPRDFSVFSSVLQQRVENSCQEIRVKPHIFDMVRTSVVQIHGNHIQRLLYRLHEHRPYLSKN
jgi:hypothetical protein